MIINVIGCVKDMQLFGFVEGESVKGLSVLGDIYNVVSWEEQKHGEKGVLLLALPTDLSQQETFPSHSNDNVLAENNITFEKFEGESLVPNDIFSFRYIKSIIKEIYVLQLFIFLTT